MTMRAFALAAPLLLAACVQPATEPAGSAAVRDGPMPPATSAPVGNPAIDGVPIPVGRTIAADLMLAPTLSSLVRALNTAGLSESLNATGPVTIFAPTDAAFGRLQPGTIDALMKPENRASLTKLLNLHVVPGRFDALDLTRRIVAGGGRATLMTVAGETLSVTLTSGIVTLTDAGGNKSYVETTDVRAANGVIHVVNGVLIPRLN